MTKKHRVVVAGCGGMANTWVDYVIGREDGEIVGLVDIHLEAATAMAERKGLSCPVFTDVKEAIASTEANLVFDVTIPSSHHHIGIAAMESGCDVFAEKPLAESIRDCLDIVQTSNRLGRTHAVMQNRRYDPRIRSFRNLIAEGTIGRPGFIGADFFLGPHFGGFREAMDSPLLLDMAIHTFDQARFLLGANPVSVYCHESNPPGSWYEGNAMAVCIFEMSDGSVFNYRGSWCAEGAPTSWEASWRVTGERGTAIWDGHGEPFAEVVAAADHTDRFIREYERIPGKPVAMNHTFHHGCLDEMFAALHEQRKPETDCSDNLFSMAMVLAALESAKTQSKVDIVKWINAAQRGE
ncbi:MULTISPECIES: Gfo/Idh/MocA family protein [Paenibacillus]|uniref:Oxidoreductase n=1 Tax=Paenibacillus albilobatus TaxID=2716884 RepID=A0A919XEX6_9BACL|nr:MULTISPECIES: Gfo/Idh/MocA family oxidoreductase [Paenibacillus]GIO29208.1 oxidoreductase [Paenibacillus albilobatus]